MVMMSIAEFFTVKQFIAYQFVLVEGLLDQRVRFGSPFLDRFQGGRTVAVHH